MRRRTLILLIGLPVYTFVLMLAGTFVLGLIVIDDTSDVTLATLVELPGEVLTEPEWWSGAGITAAVIVGLQALFLVPVFASRPPREQRSRSLTVSLLVAGVVAAVLTGGLGLALIDFAALRLNGDIDAKGWLWLVPLTMLAAGWVIWSLLLLFFSRGIWADRTLGRVIGLLFAGTLLELLVVVPIDIMVRRRTDCYCGTGSFFALCAAAAATLWMAGPGVIIALTSKRHRLWREQYCVGCGYPKGPSPGPRCPECGSAWTASRRTGG